RAWRLRPATVRRLALVVVLPAAGLAMAATSAPRYPTAVAALTWHDMIVVGEVDANHQSALEQPESWRASADGARTWRALTADEQARFTAAATASTGRAEQQCAPAPTADRCYRVARGHLRVEESADGGRSWTVGWGISDDRRDRWARSFDELGDAETHLSSRALTVAGRPGGHVVVVANGRDGYAVRDVTGKWQRIGFGTEGLDSWTAPASPAPGDDLPVELVLAKYYLAVLAGAVAIAVGCGWAGRGGVPGWLGLGLLLTAVPGTLLGVLGMHAGDSMERLLAAVPGTAALVVAAGLALGTAVAAGTTGTLGGRAATGIVALGVATAAGAAVPYALWARDALDERAASLLALAVGGVGVLAAGWIGDRARRDRPAPPPDPAYPRWEPAARR
ncbi:MAG TPA: hypothetical protein VES42_11870, partial [Pilimelia sp.]|nr:hypothetical protein [Pilimelia sp.]